MVSIERVREGVHQLDHAVVVVVAVLVFLVADWQPVHAGDRRESRSAQATRKGEQVEPGNLAGDRLLARDGLHEDDVLDLANQLGLARLLHCCR